MLLFLETTLGLGAEVLLLPPSSPTQRNSSEVAATGSSWDLSEVLRSPMTQWLPSSQWGRRAVNASWGEISGSLLGPGRQTPSFNDVFVISSDWNSVLRFCERGTPVCLHFGTPSPLPGEHSLDSEIPLQRGQGLGGKSPFWATLQDQQDTQGSPLLCRTLLNSPRSQQGVHTPGYFFLFSGCSYTRQLNQSHDCNLISPDSELFSFQIYEEPGNVQRTRETSPNSERLKRKKSHRVNTTTNIIFHNNYSISCTM